MVNELWFYVTTVLICTGYALLLHSFPQWKLYFSLALGGFIIGGAVLVYWDAEKREDVQARLAQLERQLEVANKEKEKQEALTRDAADRARRLDEELKVKTDDLARMLKDKPHVDGEIAAVRLFPWRRPTGSSAVAGATATTTGVLVYAGLRNEGADTKLAGYELSIEFPDQTIVQPQKWPAHKSLRIACEDGAVNVSRDQLLNAKSEPLDKTEERSGVTVWMIKYLPPAKVRTADSVYTLTVRDGSGMVHALKSFRLSALPQPCSGFDVVD